MAINFTVPVIPSSSYTTTIEKTGYVFRFNWQERSKSWYLDVTTGDGNVVTKAVKLLPNVPLIRRSTKFSPPGNLYVVSNNVTEAKVPGRYNIGPSKDFSLYYLTEEELA